MAVLAGIWQAMASTSKLMSNAVDGLESAQVQGRNDMLLPGSIKSTTHIRQPLDNPF